MKTKNWYFRIFLILLGMGLFTSIYTGCKKSSDTTSDGFSTLPVLTTAAVTNINSTTASCGGDITSNGGETITARGVCWSTAQNPTVADNKTSDGTGTGSFTSSIQGLTPATPYNVRAYATNSTGTSYGNAQTFTTSAIQPGIVVDLDGNVYHIDTIGSQVWLVENLKVTHYRNGDLITPGKSTRHLGPTASEGKYWNYGNSDSLGKIYGRLYNFYAVIDPRNIAPQGWRVATNDDMTALAAYLGADSIAGGKLKEAGTAHWASPNIGATNESGFTALPAGNYNAATGFFSFLRYGTTIWTSTEHGADEGYVITLFSNSGTLNHGYSIPKFGGASVRCLKGD